MKHPLLTILLSYFLFFSLAGYAKSPPSSPLPLNELQLFVNVFHQIKDKYVNEISDAELLELAIRGMLENLDPHSDFLNQADFQSLKNDTSGEFAGLGIEVIATKEAIKVISPIEGTPAAKAGIKSGDLIIKINQQALRTMNSRETMSLLQGKKGSHVELTIVREGEIQPLIFKITRDTIKVKSVSSKLITEGFGYLKIIQFQKKTATEAKKQILTLAKKNKKPLEALIIDLRNNPGGLLNSAIKLANLFITEGIITYTANNNNHFKEKFLASSEQIIAGTPIVVLVNSGSASSSEVLAGALQDHQRAVIVGTSTFGKGSIQSIIPLQAGKAIKLTTANYFTPSGKSIQALGVKPDIIIQQKKITTTQKKPIFIESNYRPSSKKPKQSKDEKLIYGLQETDFQLYEAVNIAKAMSYTQNNKKIEQARID